LGAPRHGRGLTVSWSEHEQTCVVHESMCEAAARIRKHVSASGHRSAGPLSQWFRCRGACKSVNIEAVSKRSRFQVHCATVGCKGVVVTLPRLACPKGASRGKSMSMNQSAEGRGRRWRSVQ
jgi:hypothetical protein